MQAFKFLDEDGTTALTGYRWPRPTGRAPGPWVEADAVRPCHEGLHGCSADHLAYWISDQLWLIELDGEPVPGRHKVVARRARLVRRVTTWHRRVRSDLAFDVAWRTRDLAVAALRRDGRTDLGNRLSAARSLGNLAASRSDIADVIGRHSVAAVAALLAGDCGYLAQHGEPAEAPFVAACAAGHVAASAALAGAAEEAYETAFHAERARQSRWIAERIGVKGQR